MRFFDIVWFIVDRRTFSIKVFLLYQRWIVYLIYLLAILITKISTMFDEFVSFLIHNGNLFSILVYNGKNVFLWLA